MADWFGEAGTTTAQSTTAGTFHDGTGSLRLTKTLTVGTGRTIRVNTGTTAVLTADNGVTLAVWVLVPGGTAGTNWRARIEMQDASSAWQPGADTNLTAGSWAQLLYTPSDAVWDGSKGIAVQFSCDQTTAPTVSVYMDTVQQGSMAGAMTPAQRWEAASRECVAAIRGLGDTATIYVPGYQQGAQSWLANHPAPWISGTPNIIYDAQYYLDRDNSGAYVNTYAAENSNALTRGYSSLTQRATTELAQFLDWCTANSVAGFLSEIGWPNTADAASWNAVGDACYDALVAAGVGRTQWAAGQRYSGPLAVYTGTPLSTPTATAAVAEGAYAPPASSTMPVGNLPNWTQSYVQDFTTPAALGQIAATYGAGMRGYNGFTDTSKNGTYSPDLVLTAHNNAAGANGVLDWHLHTEGGLVRVACPVPDDYRAYQFGKFELRVRSDNLPGYKIAFLLWPSSDRWNDGEVDWPETANLATGTPASPASAIPGTLGDGANGMMIFSPPSRVYSATDLSSWHIAGMEWTPGLIVFTWDGVEVGRVTGSAVPTGPMRWTLQGETQITGGAPAAATAGHLMVDWLAAYTYDPITVYATEIWGGKVDGIAWPAQWTKGPQGGTATIEGGKGRLVTPAVANTLAPVMHLGAMTARADFECTFTIAATIITSYPCISLRSDGVVRTADVMTNNCYYIVFKVGSQQIEFGRVVAGTKTILGQVNYTNNYPRPSHVRVKLVGALYQVRVWAAGSAEPTTWNMWNATDATPYLTAGKITLSNISGPDGTAKTVEWDQLVMHNPWSDSGVVATAPAQVATPTATAGNAAATVSWSAPSSGGSAITGYDIENITTGAVTPVGVVTTATITGLTNGSPYTFRVRAKNAVGAGPYSSATSAVTPVSATAPAGATTVAQNLYTTQTPTALNANDGQPLSVGTHFMPTADGQVLGVRYYCPATAPTTVTALLFTEDGSIELARQTQTGTKVTGSWNTITFDTPANVATEQNYMVAIWSSGPYVYANNGFPLSSGELSGNQGCWRYTATPAPPNNTTQTSYFVDPVFKAFSRIPWEGGPAYYQPFPNAVTMGMTSDTFIPLLVDYEAVLNKEDSDRDKAYGVNGYYRLEANTDMAAIRANNMIAFPFYPPSPSAGVETVGWNLTDEPDMWAGPGWNTWNGLYDGTAPNSGYDAMYQFDNNIPEDNKIEHINYGKGIVFWQNSAAAEVFVNGGSHPDGRSFEIDAVSADLYFYSDTNTLDEATAWFPQVPVGQVRRAANYGRHVVNRVRSLMLHRNHLQPVYGFVECTSQGSNVPQADLTDDKIEGAVWSCFLYEARGVIYFVHDFTYSGNYHNLRDNIGGHTARVTSLNARLKALAPVLNTQSYYANFNPTVKTMTKWYNGSWYVFAMSRRQATHDTAARTFTLPSFMSGGTVTVVDENRTLTIVNGTFSDTFAAEYTCHIYKIVPGSGPAQAPVTLTAIDGETTTTGALTYYSSFSRTSVLNDPNFFPFCVFYTNPNTAADAQRYKDLGVNMVLPNGGANLSALSAAGIYNICNFGDSPAPNNETIFMWGGDEADMNVSGTLAQRLAAVDGAVANARAGGGTSRAVMTNFGKWVGCEQIFTDLEGAQFLGVNGTPRQDQAGLDFYFCSDFDIRNGQTQIFYNVGAVPLALVKRGANYGSMISRVRRLHRQQGLNPQPQWAFIETAAQSAEVGDDAITENQLKAAAWSAVVHGARGIHWFVYCWAGSGAGTQDTLRAAAWDEGGALAHTTVGVKTVSAQIKAVAPYLLSPWDGFKMWGQYSLEVQAGFLANVTPTPTWDGGIDASCHYHVPTSKHYVMASSRAISTAATQTATFTIAGNFNGTAREVFKNYDRPIVNGVFTDTFNNGDDYHCYRID